ncbi:hypothetical protein INT47_001767 [Mucor saturninus]|uniref:4-coumarate--CoA ligase n=1 Tax=Mucor saturninus TaxID=64648 RepID=A0A8H7V6X5_9FUNG|nr:hypothetical protein INT47_001767 [Mucor saturninus]
MVYKSKIPAVNEPTIGFLQFLFENEFKISQDKPLLIDALDTARFLTFPQIKKLTLQFGAGLQDVCYFKKGDVLAIYAPNQYDYAIPVYGAIAASGTVTTINPNYNIEELYYQLSETESKVLIFHHDNADIALAAGTRAGIDRKNMFVFGDQAIKGVQPFRSMLLNVREAVLEDLTLKQCKNRIALLCFSSGTGGNSKGVMTTHANLTSNITQYAAFKKNVLNSKDSSRMLTVLPFYHAFGLMAAFCGAAPLSYELWNETMTRLPHLIIRQLYGSTETSPLVTIEPVDKVVGGSVGLLLPNMTAKIMGDDGHEITTYGERGELWIKGPNIMKGYLNNPGATAESIDSDGYLHTGDIVLTDRNGHFFIVDRKKELIKYKGFAVAPAEIEGILLTHPMIDDCAVIGVYNDDQATEDPRAYVVLRNPAAASEETGRMIMKYVTDQVVYYKQVRSIRFVSVIPKNSSGKILRRILREDAKNVNIKAFSSKL